MVFVLGIRHKPVPVGVGGGSTCEDGCMDIHRRRRLQGRRVCGVDGFVSEKRVMAAALAGILERQRNLNKLQKVEQIDQHDCKVVHSTNRTHISINKQSPGPGHGRGAGVRGCGKSTALEAATIAIGNERGAALMLDHSAALRVICF